MICAAIGFENEKKEINTALIETTCANWSSNIHLALQFAVIQYFTDQSQLGRETWFPIIKTLLSLNANPNYPSIKYKNTLVTCELALPIADVKTAFTVVISQPEATNVVLELASDFANQQEKLATKMDISAAQAMRIFPKVQPNSKQVYFSNAWFKWLEKNYPEPVKQHLLANTPSIIAALAANGDYDSIDYVKIQYGVDPFLTLIEREE